MTRRYVLFGSICCALELASAIIFTAEQQAAHEHECLSYVQTTGCGWTLKNHCPGQATTGTDEGMASDDGSKGFTCCCTYGLYSWKSTESVAPTPAPTAAPVAAVVTPFTAGATKAFQAQVGGSPKVGFQGIVPFKELTTTFGDVYDVSSTTFKVPVGSFGIYFFNFVIYAHNTDSPDEFHFYLNGVDTGVGCYNLGDYSTPCASSLIRRLAVGDTVDVRSQSTANVYVRPLSSFSGVRLDFGTQNGFGDCAFQQVVAVPLKLTDYTTTGVCSLVNTAVSTTFTAQKKAVYYFSFNMPTTEETILHNASYTFVVNGVDTLVGCYRKAGWRESCAATLIRVLNVGDTVTLSANKAGTVFKAPTLTDFEGFLLRQATDPAGTSFEVVASDKTVASNDIVWDQPILATSVSTWYTLRKWVAPSQGTYFFSIYVLSRTAGGTIEFMKNTTVPLGLGCYDDGPYRRVCRANAVLHMLQGESLGLRSTNPVAPLNLNSIYVSHFVAFQIDKASAVGIAEGACFTKSVQYSPDLAGAPVTVQLTDLACQTHCYQTPGCGHFSWNTQDHNCRLIGKQATTYPAHYVTSGPATCAGMAGAAGVAAARRLPEAPVLNIGLGVPAPPPPVVTPLHHVTTTAKATTTTITKGPTTTTTTFKPHPPAGHPNAVLAGTIPAQFTTDSPASGIVPGALIAGGVTLAGAAVGGLIAAVVHNHLGCCYFYAISPTDNLPCCLRTIMHKGEKECLTHAAPPGGAVGWAHACPATAAQGAYWRGAPPQTPNVKCSCTTPNANAGLVGFNDYKCSDGTTGACAATVPCSATTAFPKTDLALGCKAIRAREAEPAHGSSMKYSIRGRIGAPGSAAQSWQSLLWIGGLCGLIAAGSFGAYVRRKRRQSRQFSVVSAGGETESESEVFFESRSSEQQVSTEVSTRKRAAAGAGMLALVALVAFALVKGGAGPAQAAEADAKGTVSEFSVINSPQQLFESDDFSRRLTRTTLRHVNIPHSKPMEARLQAAFKAEFHSGLRQFVQLVPSQASALQLQLPPGSQDFVYGLLEKMYDPHAQNLGKRILNSMKAVPAGESPEESHRRLLHEHGEQISESAQALFPNGLDDVAFDRSKPVYDAEDGIMGLNERRLLPAAARARIGPVRSEIVVGTGVSAIGMNIIELILTALNVASGPGFLVKIPTWAIGLLSSLSAALTVTSCAVQNYDRSEGLVNATFDPKGNVPASLEDLGIHLGIQIPGWLKCTLFSGISALVTIISFVVSAVKGKLLL